MPSWLAVTETLATETTGPPAMWRRVLLWGAGVALVVDGLGFGVFVPPAIASLARGEGVPTVFGYPTYGGGPFEDLELPTTIPLLLGFLAVCLVLAVVGVMVARRQRAGAVLALELLPVGALFWWGFALPYGPVLGVLAAVLIVLGWPALRR